MSKKGWQRIEDYLQDNPVIDSQAISRPEPNEKSPSAPRMAPNSGQREKVEGKRSLHTLAYYFFRTIGAASLVLGGAGIMTDISFGVSAGCIYLGLLILCADAWIEPALAEVPFRFRIIPSLVFLIPILAFSRYIVFASAPMEVRATDYNGNFPPGRLIGGKPVNPKFSTLHVSFKNPTQSDYKDIDFVVASDQYVISAQADVPWVIVLNTTAGPDEVTFPKRDGKGGVSYADDTQKQLLSGGIRVICDKLPKGMSFDITMAIANVPSAGKLAHPQSSDQLLAIGRSDIDIAFGPRTAATVVGISGSYSSLAGRPHRLRSMYSVKQQ